MNPTLKKWFKNLISLVVFGVSLLAALWLTSPDRLGRAAFAATGLPERTWAEAQFLAREQNKPLLLDFSAYWCGYCRQLDRKVLSDERVKTRIGEHYIFVRLDSENPDTIRLMRQYGVQGFPTLVIMAADGTLLRRLPSSADPDAFLQAL
jgi:thiol:disulfide interchange protein DsbD